MTASIAVATTMMQGRAARVDFRRGPASRRALTPVSLAHDRPHAEAVQHRERSVQDPGHPRIAHAATRCTARAHEKPRTGGPRTRRGAGCTRPTVQIAMTDGSNADSSDRCRRPSGSNARSPALDGEAEILAVRDDTHRHVALAVRLD